MSYHLSKMLYTLQGEGANTGRAAVLCNFDTRKRLTTQSYNLAGELVLDLQSLWPRQPATGGFVNVVCTGPDLHTQLDKELLSEFHRCRCHVAAELNGEWAVPEGLDWITVKPRPGQRLLVRQGQELKIEYPIEGLDPREFEELKFQYHFIQPVANERWVDNTVRAIRYCLNNPLWRLAYQIQKVAGFP